MIFCLNGISFATVQIKEHFYCTNLKRCVIYISSRLKKVKNAGTPNNGIKGLNTLSIATNNLPKRNPKETLPSFGFPRFAMAISWPVD